LTPISWICIIFIVVSSIGLARAAEDPADPPGEAQYSRTLTLKWEAPTKRLDGTPLAEDELLRYDIEFNGEAYTAKPTANHYDVIVNDPGLYCAKIKAVDTENLSSPWSEPACLAIRHAPAKIRIWFDGAE
jgi:hypothetical protein